VERGRYGETTDPERLQWLARRYDNCAGTNFHQACCTREFEIETLVFMSAKDEKAFLAGFAYFLTSV
jgi:hypothetical protein